MERGRGENPEYLGKCTKQGELKLTFDADPAKQYDHVIMDSVADADCRNRSKTPYSNLPDHSVERREGYQTQACTRIRSGQPPCYAMKVSRARSIVIRDKYYHHQK